MLPKQPKANFIGGQYVAPTTGKFLPLIDPHTEEQWAECAASAAGDIELAVQAAEAATTAWRDMGTVGRRNAMLNFADLMARDAEDLATLEVRVIGCPLKLQLPVIQALADDVRYYAGWSDKLANNVVRQDTPHHVAIVHEPLGVCGIIVPWNLPLWSLIAKLAPCLAMGNTAVVKPSELSPFTALRVAELCIEAGMPRGVVNVVNGTGADAGEALVAHMRVRKVAFTGSTAVGRRIMSVASATNLKRVQLELGGKNAIIVARDADVARAVELTSLAMFTNAGEICTAASRIFVHDEIHDAFVAALAAHVKTLSVGDARTSDIGPMVSRTHFNKVMGYITAGENAGARVVAGGKRRGARGFFVEPTVFVDARDDMSICTDEIFGPVLVVLRYTSIDDAIRRANATEYGLAAGVISHRGDYALEIARRLEAGTVWCNTYHAVFPGAEFGGVKQSGFGRDGGRVAVEEWTQTKAMTLALPAL